WLFLCRHRNPNVPALASWLLTISVLLSPLAVEDVACWWFRVCGAHFHPPVSASAVLFWVSLLALCATGLARFTAGMAIALLGMRHFDSIDFWTVDALLGVCALLLDEHQILQKLVEAQQQRQQPL